MTILGLMAVYNEADIVGHVIQHTINQGLELLILDNGSTDGSYQICQKFVGRGVLEIQRIVTEVYDPIFILRRLEEMAQTYGPDWLAIIDDDEIHEPPLRGFTLKQAIEREESLGYNLIQSDCFVFWPTSIDDKSEKDPVKRIKYYVWSDDFHFPFWRNYPGTDCWSGGSHVVYFPQGIKRKVSPRKFVIRHYNIRSSEQGRRKVFGQRRRFRRPPLPEGWMIHYNRFTMDESWFSIDKEKLTRYNEDCAWSLDRRFDTTFGSWCPPNVFGPNSLIAAGPLRYLPSHFLTLLRNNIICRYKYIPLRLLFFSRRLLGRLIQLDLNDPNSFPVRVPYEIGTKLPRNEEVWMNVLLDLCREMPNLRNMFPEVNVNREYGRLVEWIVEYGLRELPTPYRVLAPLLTLRYVYDRRRDIQQLFPEVHEKGDYTRLAEWLVNVGLTSDKSADVLRPYAHWYSSYVSGLKGRQIDLAKKDTDNTSDQREICVD